MANSNFVFEEGEAIDVGRHGDHDYVYADGNKVVDAGDSTIVFESGVGLGGGDIIDDFEDADLSEYTGETNDWNFTTAAYEGTYALRTTVNNSELNSVSGLPYYPTRGDKVEYYAKVGTNESGVEMDCLVQAIETQYEFQIYGFVESVDKEGIYDNNGALSIVKRNQEDVGSATPQAGSRGGSAPPLGEWVRGVIGLGSSTLTFEVFSQDSNGDFTNSLGSISFTDTEFTGGGIGWSSSQSTSNSNTDVAVDFARKVGTV